MTGNKAASEQNIVPKAATHCWIFLVILSMYYRKTTENNSENYVSKQSQMSSGLKSLKNTLKILSFSEPDKYAFNKLHFKYEVCQIYFKNISNPVDQMLVIFCFTATICAFSLRSSSSKP